MLVPPQTGRRKILILEGAPGYEHTFLKRALGQDPGLDVDAVVRKGQNDDGRDTFYVQAAPSRMAALSSGYPSKRSELFAYDAVIFGNIEADFFTREQLALTSEFVAERGGGLLVLGARSFDRQGLAGTALEHALPVDLTDRRGTITLAAAQRHRERAEYTGLDHGRLDAPGDAAGGDRRTRTAQKWAALPALASMAPVGGARPGAQVLAVALTAGGNPQPLIADAALRPGPIDGVRRRSVVALAHDAAGHRQQLRNHLAPAGAVDHRGRAGAGDHRAAQPDGAGHHRSHQRVRARRGLPRRWPTPKSRSQITAPNGEKRQLTAALSNPQDGRYAVATRFDQPASIAWKRSRRAARRRSAPRPGRCWSAASISK